MAPVLVDVVLAVLLLGAAARGWQRGALRLTLTFCGFAVGVAAGFAAAPLLATLATGATRTVLLLAWLTATALVGAWAGELAGRHLEGWRRHGALVTGDRAVGTVLGVVGGAVVLWLVGTLAAATAPEAISQPLRDSAVLRAVTGIMPDPPGLIARVESLFSRSGFPVVLVNLPPGLATPEPLPGEDAVRAAATAVQPSTVKVTGEACGFLVTGSGFAVSGALVVTNAHVVAGEASTSVTDAAGTHAASVVFYDPGLDVAVLKVPGLHAPAAHLSPEPVAAGTAAAVAGYPDGGPFQVSPAAVNARFEAVGLDIYGTSLTSRDVYELHATVRAGDSGGPLVSTGGAAEGTAPVGTVVGVVFSRAASQPDVGYALAMAPVVAAIDTAETATSPVGTGACVP